MNKKYWPARLNETLVAGAMEVGRDLFLLGNFGGFGGMLHPDVYPTREDAIAAAREWNSKKLHHVAVYKLTCTLEEDRP